MSQATPRPCPFCGEDTDLHVSGYIGGSGDTFNMVYRVCCGGCMTQGPHVVGHKPDAVSAWNEREDKT